MEKVVQLILVLYFLVLKLIKLQLVLFLDLQLILFVFPNALPSAESVNLACFIFLL